MERLKQARFQIRVIQPDGNSLAADLVQFLKAKGAVHVMGRTYPSTRIEGHEVVYLDPSLAERKEIATMDREFISVDQIASRMGWHRRTVYRHLREGVIPGRLVGNRWIVLTQQFDAWLYGKDA